MHTPKSKSPAETGLLPEGMSIDYQFNFINTMKHTQKSTARQALRSILGGRPIAFHPELARILGGIAEAIYFQQLHFWGDKGHDPDGWIYKSKKDIQDETTLTRDQQDRIRKKLEKMGALETCKKQIKGAPTLHYRTNIDFLIDQMVETETRETHDSKSGKPANQNSGKPANPLYTENTTETTPENIENVLSFYQEKINKGTRMTDKAKTKLKARLKTFTVEDIRLAIANFAADDWKMKNLAKNGLAWFLHSDDRIETYRNLGHVNTVEPENDYDQDAVTISTD